MSRPVAVLSSLVLLGVAACSAPPTIKPGEPYSIGADLAVTKERLFSVLTGFVHDLDLRIQTIDKEDGVLVLEPKTVGAEELEEACIFPAIDEDGDPATSFTAYDKERTEDGEQGVSGTVALSILVRELDEASSRLSIKAAWTATNGEKTVACDSKGVRETEWLQQLKDRLLSPDLD